MNDLTIETVYCGMTNIPEEPIRSQFKNLNKELSKCDKASIISFAGTMNHLLFVNLVKHFATNLKKILYYQNLWCHKRLFMELITLNATNNDLENSKEQIKSWDLTLCDTKIPNLEQLKKDIEETKPHYIFIDNLNDFSVGNLSENELLIELLDLIYRNNAILFINLGNTEFVDKIKISRGIRLVSNVIFYLKWDEDDIFLLVTLKSLNLQYGEFSLKYDYKHFKFNEIVDSN